MKRSEIFPLIKSNSMFKSCLQAILFEKYPELKPDLMIRNPERATFTEERYVCTQYYGEGWKGTNVPVEGKSLYYKDLRFKKSFNEAIEATIAILKTSKLR